MPLYSEAATKSPYWNEYLETMPRDKLDQLHLRRLQAMIKYAYENAPMYRDLYDRAGVKPEDVKTLDDYIDKIPTIDKSDVVAYQAKNPPFGDAIVRGGEEYVNIFYMTSGSTGKPMMEPGYFKDIHQQWTYKWWAHGIRQNDVFYFAFPFGTFMGFWSAYFDALMMGCQVISSGGQDSKGRIRQILELKPTVLCATPTYILHLAEVARDMGVNPAETSIKFLTMAGEQGAVVASLRKAMEEAWGARALDLYGISELWGSTSWHCPMHLDRLHLSETVAYGVVLDEDGRKVPSGGRGEFVLTTYNATVMPLIKYRTHDVVEWHLEGCDCGRSWLWLREGVLGRTDQMVTIKGTNVYPAGLQAILGEIPQLSENMEIHFTTEADGDAVTVKVEPIGNVSQENYPQLQQQVAEELHRKVGVRIGVELVPPKSLPRYEQKAKRIFDNRKK
ncbi:MAG: phenylacetate--CoA ligase family protein [Clostridia bacterium]|nr:MAG: phenylacetate--CoA ligase family protein [Clostridia bacterium]